MCKLYLIMAGLWSKLPGLVLLVILLSQTTMASETCLSARQRLAEVEEWGISAKIIDGDTIHLQDGRKVRLIGINTPEIGRRGEASQPFARKAQKALRRLLADDNKIGLSFDLDKKDRYKRLLSYVILSDGRSVEQILLEQGLAHSIVVPPNVKHIDCYRKIEKKARQSKMGLWQLPENQLIEARYLPAKSKGYRLVSGTVSAFSESKKSIYLKLTAGLSIRIGKKDLKEFSGLKLKSLVGKKVLFRGWLSTYKGRQLIHVRSRHDIEF